VFCGHQESTAVHKQLRACFLQKNKTLYMLVSYHWLSGAPRNRRYMNNPGARCLLAHLHTKITYNMLPFI
jgi:hypothetical protein